MDKVSQYSLSQWCLMLLLPSVGGSQELVSPCLAPDYTGEWEHAEVTYTLKGQKAGMPQRRRLNSHLPHLPRFVAKSKNYSTSLHYWPSPRSREYTPSVAQPQIQHSSFFQWVLSQFMPPHSCSGVVPIWVYPSDLVQIHQ